MTDRIQELADQAKLSIPAGMYEPDAWIQEYNRRFAESIVTECIAQCGSQADKHNLRHYFGLPVESTVKYPAPAADGSVKSQYTREYNFPKKRKK